MITLSVDVLRAQPTDATIPLRQWAIDTIEKRGNFKFTSEQQEALVKYALPGPLHGSFLGVPNGTPCGAYPGMTVEDGQCMFGGGGAVAK